MLYVLIALVVVTVIGITYTAFTKRPQYDVTNTSSTIPAQNNPSSNLANPPVTDTTYEDIYGTSACTSDCSGHDAGYSYAEENEICDTEYDSGNSESFNEGVISWAEDNC